ncbi:MAG: hypothetical protein K0S60_401 [Evtepia sp.]|nr:hypothetical protein [Evtepia sp.]
MKRFLVTFMLLTVLSSGSCYAANLNSSLPESKMQVSLDKMEQIWTNHSPDLSKIENDLNSSRKAYDNLDYALDKANDRMDASVSFLNGRDQAKLAYDVASAQYNQRIQNSILATKQDFLTIWQDQLNLDYAKENLDQKQAQLSKNADGLGKGYLSQKTFDEMKNTVDELQNSVSNLRMKLETDQTTLKTKLGLDQNTKLEYTYPTLDEGVFKKLMSIDPKADFAALQKNSVNLKVLKITYDSLSLYTRSYANGIQVEGAELNLKTAQNNLPANFSTQYQHLINQYDDLSNEYRKLALEKEKLYRVQKQCEMGFVSSLTLSNLKLEYYLMESGVKVKESALYGSYLSYLNMVAGN